MTCKGKKSILIIKYIFYTIINIEYRFYQIHKQGFRNCLPKILK